MVTKLDCNITKKYYLKSDGLNLWLEQDFKIKDKKGNEKIVKKRVSGYCGTYSDLLDNFTKIKIKSIEKQKVVDIIKEIADIEKEILKVAKDIGKEFDK